MKQKDSSQQFATLFAALADPTRLRLLNLIGDREVCVCYLVEILQQTQPKISRHLAYLRKAGLVDARRDGKWMHYRMLPPRTVNVAAVLKTTLESLRRDKQMRSDLALLDRACCQPDKFAVLQGAPAPVRVGAHPG